MNFLSENKEWLFSGLAVTILTVLGKILYNSFFKKKTETNEIQIKNTNTNTNTNTNSSNIILNNNIKVLTPHRGNKHKESVSKNENLRTKEITRILFIDDDVKFKMVNILKKSGWINTKNKKDIIDLDDPDAKAADIIFVDINGVGTELFQDQGLGLASALKTKYPKKKIIIYSAESNGDRFHKAFKITDDSLSKNAEPYEFIHLVETFSHELFES